jgi:hypothetical protein
MEFINETKFANTKLSEFEQKKYLDSLIFWKKADVGDFVTLISQSRKIQGKIIRAIETPASLLITMEDNTTIELANLTGTEWYGFAIQKQL